MTEPLDPSQKPAEPLQPVKPSVALKRLAIDEAAKEIESSEQPEAIENRQRAAAEISMIFELKDSSPFNWFMREFVDKPYQEAFDKLRDPRLLRKDESLEIIQQRYVALRAVRVGMIEREIAHREQIDPNDEQISELRRLLSSL